MPNAGASESDGDEDTSTLAMPEVLICGWDAPEAESISELVVEYGGARDGAARKSVRFPVKRVTKHDLDARLYDPASIAAVIVGAEGAQSLELKERTGVLASSLAGIVVFILDGVDSAEPGIIVEGNSANGDSVSFDAALGFIRERLAAQLELIDADYTTIAKSVETSPLGESDSLRFVRIVPPITAGGFVTAYLHTWNDNRTSKSDAATTYTLARKLLAGVYQESSGESGLIADGEIVSKFAEVKSWIRRIEIERTFFALAIAALLAGFLFELFAPLQGVPEGYTGSWKWSLLAALKQRKSVVARFFLILAIALLVAAIVSELKPDLKYGLTEMMIYCRQGEARHIALAKIDTYNMYGTSYSAKSAGFLKLETGSRLYQMHSDIPLTLKADKTGDSGWEIKLTSGHNQELTDVKVSFRGNVFFVGTVKPDADIRLTIAPVEGGQGHEDAMAASDSADAVFSLIRRIEKRRFGKGNAQRNVEAALDPSVDQGTRSNYERIAALSCGYELLYELAKPGAPYLTAQTLDDSGNYEMTLEHFGTVVDDDG